MKASGSRLPLLARCAYTMRPDVDLPESHDSEASVRGKARHRDFEAWVNRSVAVDPFSAWPDAEAARLRFLLELSQRFEAWRPTSTETVLVYDVLAGTTRRSPHGRTHDDPDAKPSEIRLVADIAQDDLVCDYKTGRPIEGADEQTRALALAWARLHGLETVRAALAYVDDDGRIWRWDEQRLDLFDLEEVAEHLRELYEHESEHQPRPGPWCRELYCPLAGSCPATAPALTHAAGGGLVPSLDPQTPEEATALWQARNAVRRWEMTAHDALRRYVDGGRTIDIGDGRRWGRVETKGAERVTLTPDGVRYLRGVLPDAIEESTSKTAIAKHAPTTKEARAIIEDLGKLGCLSSKTTTKYEEIEE